MKTTGTASLFLVCVLTACSGTRHDAARMGPVEAGVGTLVVQIAGLRSEEGLVSVSLFDDAQGFPQDTAAVFRSATLELSGNPERVVRFDELGYGDYAVAVLHDENGNGAMDTGFLGVPSEGFGFSNNPTLGFGPPSFESCRLRFAAPELSLVVQLRYF